MSSAVSAGEYWETRYADSPKLWSGRVNAVLADVAATLPPGTALDLGCGEGADVLWLAERGWIAKGVDISATAIARARAEANRRGISAEQAWFVVADLGNFLAETKYNLVTASFLHSPVELPREKILRAAASSVKDGGHLLITSHADFPPWVKSSPNPPSVNFLSAAEEIAQLSLSTKTWQTIFSETRPRETVTPDGGQVILEDVVVLLQKQ